MGATWLETKSRILQACFDRILLQSYAKGDIH